MLNLGLEERLGQVCQGKEWGACQGKSLGVGCVPQLRSIQNY